MSSEDVVNEEVIENANGDETDNEEVHDTENTEETAEQQEPVTLAAGEYEKLQADLQELRERVVRQQAEFDNVRKRLRKEADESGKRALARFVRPILTEMDNFDLALTSADPEKFNDFAMGISMIKENISSTLSNSGIELIPAEGIFDPALHEVAMQQESPEHKRGEIIQVLRNGYRLGEQVIRATQVIVATEPKPAVEATPVEEETNEDTDDTISEE